MASLHRCSSWTGVLCLSLVAATASAKEKVEVPQGYEEAAVAENHAPAENAAGAANARELVEVLADALGAKVDPHVAALEGQFLQHFQRLLKSELAFARRVCQLDRSQYARIADAANRHLRMAVREYAIAQNQLRRQQARRSAITRR